MSVRPGSVPESAPPLVSSGGELVSVYVCLEARALERVLDALARVSFPINPQIYHHASVRYVHPDLSEHSEPATMVEFPAFTGQLDEVRRALDAGGIDPWRTVHVRPMLDDIHSAFCVETVPVGTPYLKARFYRDTEAEAAAP